MPGQHDIPGNWSELKSLAVMTGATADDEAILLRATDKLKIVGVNWVPAAAVTHDGTNYTTLSLRNRKADASGSVLPASRSYAATDSVAFVTEAMTLSSTASDLLVAQGDVLTVQRIHSGTGVIVPGGLVELVFQYR